jgi:CubicO group peptidase (beta-lactamase class C family)
MKKIYLWALLLFSFALGKSQNYYFPPTTGDNWDVVSPQSLGWCTNQLDSVYKYLEEKNTKGFIILKDGKIAAEKYFGDFTKDSVWYWASAGKSLTAVLIGIAQQEGKLSVDSSANKYLGEGWTNATIEQENKITVKHLLKMTSGLNEFLLPDPNCTEPKCFRYKADPDTRWAYHSGAYYMLHSVIENASGITLNQYTTQKMGNATGMKGVWAGTLFLSRARDMARFGSLILNEGKWDNAIVINNDSYFNAMINSSQTINPAYGYLWWLNGKASYKAPLVQKDFNGALVPNAPSDMYAGMGKNEQRVYIIPSTEMVVVRVGDATGQPALAVAEFDNELWGLLQKVFCNKTSVNEFVSNKITVYPNPVANMLTIENSDGANAEVFSFDGKKVLETTLDNGKTIDVSWLEDGLYILRIIDKQTTSSVKFRKQ